MSVSFSYQDDSEVVRITESYDTASKTTNVSVLTFKDKICVLKTMQNKAVSIMKSIRKKAFSTVKSRIQVEKYSCPSYVRTDIEDLCREFAICCAVIAHMVLVLSKSYKKRLNPSVWEFKNTYNNSRPKVHWEMYSNVYMSLFDRGHNGINLPSSWKVYETLGVEDFFPQGFKYGENCNIQIYAAKEW